MEAYKFRLYPSAEQERLLNEQLNLSRELYNAFLEQRIWAHKIGITINYNFQQNQIPEIKSNFGEFRNVHSQVLQDVARRVDRAYQNFFRRIREKKSGKNIKAGFPRFKPKQRYRSITYPQSGFTILENGHLQLSKIGRLRMFMHRQVDGTIKTLTITKDRVGEWYASFSAEQNNVAATQKFEMETKELKIVGADEGILNLVVMSDGTFVENPKFLKAAEERIKKAQKGLARKRKGSKNRDKARITVAKEHRKVKRQREDYAHKQSNSIVERNDFIAFEDLPIANMVKNHNLAKSILDASWYTLVQYTIYKAESAGKIVVLVDPRGTSKTCSMCGWLKKDLDRDLNAAINIYKRGMEKVGRGTPEYRPVEIGSLPERANLIGEAGSPRL